MDKQKYNNYPLTISQILGLIEANDIAIPEIQRPFVWRMAVRKTNDVAENPNISVDENDFPIPNVVQLFLF